MAKKTKDKIGDKQMAEKIMESAQDIWLAGLAVFEQAQQEGGKVFDALVKEGKKIEARTQEVTGFKLEEVLGEVKTRATSTWDKLETLVEQRIAQVLGQLGIPTSEELKGLQKRLDALESQIKEIGKAAAPARQKGEAIGKDDLKKLTGLGRALEKRLNNQGIVSFRQIALLSDQDIERLETAGVKITTRLRRYSWIEQAKEQHFLKYNEKL